MQGFLARLQFELFQIDAVFVRGVGAEWYGTCVLLWRLFARFRQPLLPPLLLRRFPRNHGFGQSHKAFEDGNGSDRKFLLSYLLPLQTLQHVHRGLDFSSRFLVLATVFEAGPRRGSYQGNIQLKFGGW